MNAPLDPRLLRPAGTPGNGGMGLRLDSQMYLMPGEWWFGREVRSVATLLGSCVALTLWHPRWKTGGMCHYLVPRRRRRTEDALDGRFGDEAVAMLFQAALKLGFPLGEYELRIFGGAYMFAGGVSAVMDIGARNIAHGRALMRRYGVAPLTADVGGGQHRNIVLDLASGVVNVRTGAHAQPPAPEQIR